MRAYEAYVENGQIYPIGRIARTNKRVRAIVTILDEPIIKNNIVDSKQALWEEIKGLYGIIRSDIDEKMELAQARNDKYANFS